MQEHEKPWTPLTVEEVDHLFSEASFPVWIAGGMALELALGQAIRESHSDINVFLLRRDHLQVREFLADWGCWAADPIAGLTSTPIGCAMQSHTHTAQRIRG